MFVVTGQGDRDLSACLTIRTGGKDLAEPDSKDMGQNLAEPDRETGALPLLHGLFHFDWGLKVNAADRIFR